MGGESSRTDCFNCNVCSNRNCDGCNHSSCVSCMNNHRYLRNLEDKFYYRVLDSKSYIKNKCIEEVDYLKRNYDIYIYYYDNGNHLNTARNILDNMKDEIYSIQKEINSFNEKRYENDKIKKLKNEHTIIMENIQKEFKEKKEKIQKLYSQKIAEKNKKKFLDDKNDLNEEKEEIERNIEEKKNEIEQYKLKERYNFDQDFIVKKKEIDLKYSSTEEFITKEYSESEKKERNNLLKNIRELNNYSKYIPQFDLFISIQHISQYLNY